MPNQSDVPAGSDSPAATLMKMLGGSYLPSALHLAAKLQISDLLANAPKTSVELAQETGTNPSALYRLLRALASVGVFAESDPGRFSLTPIAHYLRTNVPGSLRTIALRHGETWYQGPWNHALFSIETGQSAFGHVFGQELFPYLADHPSSADIFNDAICAFTEADSETILAAYDFGNCGTLVDVGCGKAGLTAAILTAHPRVRAILFDRPAVVTAAKNQLTTAGVGTRCETRSGDFFTEMPAGGDTYVLKHVIHDWDTEQALTILGNCHFAMEPSARIIVIENVIQPGNQPCLAKWMDLEMLVVLGGQERTAQEYHDLLSTAGFQVTQHIATSRALHVIEARKQAPVKQRPTEQHATPSTPIAGGSTIPTGPVGSLS